MKISTQKEKTSKASVFGKIGIFSASLLAASSAVYLYSPVIGSHADSSATADVNLSVSEVMSLTLDKNALNLSASLYSFTSGTVTATASTNSQYGYTLTLEDVDSSSDMTHTNTSIDSKLTSDFSGSKTSSEMENNTWGFSLDATDFYKVPVNGSPVALKRTTTPMTTDSESTDVTFGAKVGNLTSGTYTDKVLFTMYVNGQDGKPKDGDDPDDPGEEEVVSACSGKTHVSGGVLTDPRDNNTYTVAELADGKCWMTQNLRLVGPISLASENSAVSDTFALPAPVASTTNWTYERVDSTKNLSDVPMHMAASDTSYGVYYNWYTATAGTGFGDTATSATAPSSICPNGWHLPTDREWYNFTYAYSGEYGTMDGPTAAASPISMVYSGAVYAPQYYNSWKAYIGNAGNAGYLWSSTKDNVNPVTMDIYGATNTTGYGANIATTISHNYNGDGYPVRCVAN